MDTQSQPPPWRKFTLTAEEYKAWKRRRLWICSILTACIAVVIAVCAFTRSIEPLLALMPIVSLGIFVVLSSLEYAIRWNKRYDHPDCRAVYLAIKARLWFYTEDIANATELDVSYVREILERFYADGQIGLSTDKHYMREDHAELRYLVRA